MDECPSSYWWPFRLRDWSELGENAHGIQIWNYIHFLNLQARGSVKLGKSFKTERLWDDCSCFISSSLSSSISEQQGSFGHHRWFHNQFAPFFPVLHCPLGLGKLQACPFPDVVFPPLPLSALSSPPSHCALQDGFGQTWWTGDMTMPLQFASLYDGQEVFMCFI